MLTFRNLIITKALALQLNILLCYKPLVFSIQQQHTIVNTRGADSYKSFRAKRVSILLAASRVCTSLSVRA